MTIEKVEKLDLIDYKILCELDKNSRISYSELGKKIRVAKETVKYRINLLEKTGVIKGYYTLIDFSKLGYTVYRPYVRLQNASPKIEAEITNYLKNKKNVGVFYRINGEYHLALGVFAKSIWEYQEFWTEFKIKFGEYFSSYHLSVFTEYVEFSRSYLIGSKNTEKLTFNAITESKQEKLDGLDYKLLTFLSNNARASLVETSKAINMSIVTVRYHMKQLLKKNIITGFRTIFDINKLGKQYYKVDLFFKEFKNAENVRQHIISHSNVVYTEKSLVSSDLEFDVEIENFEKFTQLIESFKAKFPNDIKDYKYYSLIKNYKTSYVPNL
ncbi:MAG: Lrp/AsnC family transcriptional regulator [Candidatus Micrarchaeota archaeon]